MTNGVGKPRIAVIGLGEMGSALARALLAGGYGITVWNRSRTRVDKLVEQGATAAVSVVDAVSMSDVIVVCVSTYAIFSNLLHDPEVAQSLRGKIIVQLTTRTPSEARAGELWAKQSGVLSLEGAIQAYPMQIGTPSGLIVYSGPREAFDRVELVLRCLSGQAIFVGERIGSAAALDLAMAGTVVPGATLAFLQGAALCDAEGAPLKTYLDLVLNSLIPGLVISTMQSSVSMIEKRNYSYSGEGAPLDAWFGGLEVVANAVKDAGIDPSWSMMVLDYLRQAIADGDGQSEMAVIFEYFRGRRQSARD